MTRPQPQEIYERTMAMLKPALERVASDPEFRNRLELTPLAALDEMHVELDAATRQELEGKRFSEFWAERRHAAEHPVEVRDLPPDEGQLSNQELAGVAGGFLLAPSKLSVNLKTTTIGSYAPPYVPVGPAGDF
jgi:hypothetical protein